MDCVHRQCFLEVFLSHVVISITVAFLYVMQCRLGPEDHGHPVWFSDLDPYAQRLFRFSDSWMMLCTVEWWLTSNYLQFFLWETPSDIAPLFFTAALGNWWSSPILTSERHCHSERLFFIPNHVANWPKKLKIGPPAVPYSTFNFSGLLWLPVPTFLECVALMKSKMSQYLAWHFKMSHFKHLMCYLYSIVNKI